MQAAAAQAGRLRVGLDLAWQARVRVLCLDAIFLHREPILMAIEPHSLAWMAGQRGPDRRGGELARGEHQLAVSRARHRRWRPGA